MKRYTGLALCCGKVPKYYPWYCKKEPGAHGPTYVCPICGKSVGTLGGYTDKVKMLWNREISRTQGLEPKLDAPEGYRYGEFKITTERMGWSLELINIPFCLFHTAKEDVLHNKDGIKCLIDYSRMIWDLKLIINGNEVIFPTKLPKTKPFSVYAFDWEITSGETWYELDMKIYNDKWEKIIMDILGTERQPKGNYKLKEPK